MLHCKPVMHHKLLQPRALYCGLEATADLKLANDTNRQNAAALLFRVTNNNDDKSNRE